MQHRNAVVGEKFGAAPEIGFVKIDADMFEHADRYDAVERPGNVAIVLEEELRRPRQVFFRRAIVGHLQLFGREGNASDIGAAHFGQIQAEASPAGADVEHPLAMADQQLRAETTLLRYLDIVNRYIRRFKIGAAVLLVGIEEEGIKPPV